MLYLASDHGGYKLKKYLSRYLKNQLQIEFQDLGPAQYKETDDYPDYAIPLAKEVTKNKNNRGILICGSGNGMCLTANKVKGIRAILGYNIEAAELGRQHNDANVLCLAGRVLTEDHAAAVVKKFLQTKFAGGRHARRLKKVALIGK